MQLMLIFVLLLLADAAITHLGVRRFGFGIETGPHIRYLVRFFGPFGFYLSAFFLFFMGFVIQKFLGDIPLIGLCSVFVAILAWNMAMLISMELRMNRHLVSKQATLKDDRATPVHIVGESQNKYLVKEISGELQLIDKSAVDIGIR